MRPGVLECGCLWDGRVLSIEGGCTVTDHGLGRVPFVQHRLSLGGVPLDQIQWLAEWPPLEGRWIWEP